MNDIWLFKLVEVRFNDVLYKMIILSIVGIGVDNLFYFGWGLCDYMIIIDLLYFM